MNIHSIFKIAIEHNASDIIISKGSPPALKINGELRTVTKKALTATMTEKLLLEILTEEQREVLRKEKEIDFSYQTDDEVRFRGNIFLQRGSYAGAFRPISSEIPSLERLNLPGQLYDLAMSREGLILVTGPTGHGKSTTVACMIDIINTHRKAHIITIEDPIEFIHLNKKSIIEQREIGQDTHSFATALKHVLRQAPDVVLIGEIRDLETISIALTAAETGHLVMATLHTNDSVQTIDRLVDVFPAHQHDQIRLQISMCLKAVVAQRLIPRSDKKGQVPAMEILVNTPAVCNLIREGKTHQIYTVMETQARTGMITMDSSIKQLYRRGLISHDAAQERLKNPKNL